MFLAINVLFNLCPIRFVLLSSLYICNNKRRFDVYILGNDPKISVANFIERKVTKLNNMTRQFSKRNFGKFWVSELLLNANSAIFQLYHGENKLIFNEMMMWSALY